MVENYAAEGKSLARQDGKVIFIENVVPGDVVDIRLSKNKKDWAEGYPILFKSFSKERVQPFCQHFGICGGCQWQMLPYQKQLQYKQQQVIDNLTRIGKIQLPVPFPISGAVEDKFYRNKLEYTFSNKEFTAAKPARTLLGSQNWDASSQLNSMNESKNGLPIGAHSSGLQLQNIGASAVLGFHAKGFFDKVVNIEKCWLQPEPNNQIRNTVREYAWKKNLCMVHGRNSKSKFPKATT